MKQLNITIVGAGSSRTPALVGSIIDFKDSFILKKIIFYDIDDERMSLMETYIRKVLNKHIPDLDVIFTTDKTLAYKNCDAVLVQMRAGKSKMRSLDEKIPLKYGLIGQETCGPGGFAYGMRSIKAMIEMVNDIRLVNRNAWIINYTNPAAIVALALDKVFKDDRKIVNLCDQPYSMMRSYAKILNLNQYDLRCKYFGLNHFGWFTDIYDLNGKSYFEELKNYLKYHEFQPYNAEERSKSWLDTYRRVNKYLKLFPEYLPNTYLQYYFFPKEIVDESDINYTRVDEALNSREKETFAICKKAETDDDLKVLRGSVFGNLMVEVARSILYDLKDEFVIMTRNNNLISNFSEDAIVELVGRLGSEGVIVEPYGEIKTFYKGLMENQHAYEKLTVEACLEENYYKALEALTLNRTVINPELAKLVLDDLMEANKDYWTLKK